MKFRQMFRSQLYGLAAAGLVMVTMIFGQTASAQIVAPTALPAGTTVSPLPNGGSTGPNSVVSKLFDQTQSFSFVNGPTGTLRERILSYADAPSVDHPGLYFDYQISLTSGDVTNFQVAGYGGLDVYAKQCGISTCGGSGSSGVLANLASRSVNGETVIFNFTQGVLSGTAYSANLQLFANVASYTNNTAQLIDANGDSFSLSVVSPLAAVPEPDNFAMLLAGLGLMGFVVRRKKTF